MSAHTIKESKAMMLKLVSAMHGKPPMIARNIGRETDLSARTVGHILGYMRRHGLCKECGKAWDGMTKAHLYVLLGSEDELNDGIELMIKKRMEVLNEQQARRRKSYYSQSEAERARLEGVEEVVVRANATVERLSTGGTIVTDGNRRIVMLSDSRRKLANDCIGNKPSSHFGCSVLAGIEANL